MFISPSICLVLRINKKDKNDYSGVKVNTAEMDPYVASVCPALAHS